MSNWNHRLVRYEDGGVEVNEVYYNDDGSLFGFSSADVYWHPDYEGDPLESLKQQVEWFKAALDKPVIDEKEFQG